MSYVTKAVPVLAVKRFKARPRSYVATGTRKLRNCVAELPQILPAINIKSRPGRLIGSLYGSWRTENECTKIMVWSVPKIHHM